MTSARYRAAALPPAAICCRRAFFIFELCGRPLLLETQSKSFHPSHYVPPPPAPPRPATNGGSERTETSVIAFLRALCRIYKRRFAGRCGPPAYAYNAGNGFRDSAESGIRTQRCAPKERFSARRLPAKASRLYRTYIGGYI